MINNKSAPLEGGRTVAHTRYSALQIPKLSKYQAPDHSRNHPEGYCKANCSSCREPALHPSPQPPNVQGQLHCWCNIESQFIGPIYDQLDEISPYSQHQQCSLPRTPRGQQQGHRPTPPQSQQPTHSTTTRQPRPQPKTQ